VRLQHPLATVTPTLDGAVLTVLAGAEIAFTVGDLQRLIPGRSGEGIRKTVTRLVDEGVVTAARTGRTYSYRLNRDHLAAEAIVMLANLGATLLERIRTTIGEWQEAPSFGAVFGSAARREMTNESDIDLFLVHRADADLDQFQAQTDQLTRKVTAWTGNDARILVYGETDVTGAGDRDPVLRSIAREGKPVVGDLLWFRRTITSRRRA
jgi:predicted nucleotidyltransferase